LFRLISKIIETPFYSSGLVPIIYKNGLSSYVLAPEKFAVKDLFYSGSVLFKAKAKVGYSIPIGYVNLFSRISNVEKYPFRGSIIARSAGTSMLLTNKSGGRISIKLKSGWNLLLSAHCICTVGPTSSSNIKFVNIKKAGLSRSLGFRPVVRGVAMILVIILMEVVREKNPLLQVVEVHGVD
jgi:large subunit ribosomal protein L2